MFGEGKANRNTRKTLQARFLALLLAMAMLLGLSGVTALAEGDTEIPAETAQVQAEPETPAETGSDAPAAAPDAEPEAPAADPQPAEDAEAPAAETPASETADGGSEPAQQPEEAEAPEGEAENPQPAETAAPVTYRGYAQVIAPEGEEDVQVKVYTTETSSSVKGTLSAGAVVNATRTEGVRRLYVSFYADGEAWFGYVEPEAFAYLTEAEAEAFEAASEALSVVDRRGRSFYDMSAFFVRNEALFPKVTEEHEAAEGTEAPEEVPAVVPAEPSAEAPAAEVEAVSVEAPAAEVEAVSVEAPAAEVEAVSVEAPAAKVEAVSAEASATEVETISVEAPAPEADAASVEAPAPEAADEPAANEAIPEAPVAEEPVSEEPVPEEIVPEEPAPERSDDLPEEIAEPEDDEPLAVVMANADGDDEPATVSFTGSLLWSDGDDQDGLRPDSVEVYLGRNTASNTTIYRASGTNATMTEADGWTYTWTNLPAANSAGEAYKYHLYETTPTGYTRSYPTTDHKVLRNRHEPEVRTVSVTKVWEDGSNQLKLRPDSVTVNLLADGDTAVTQRLRGSSNKWTYTFRDLPKYRDHGTEIIYTVEEEAVPEYESATDGSADEGFTITNTHEIERISIKVTKVWNDSYDYDKVRPASVTIKLKANNRETGDTLVLTKADATTSSTKWEGSFDNLPKYDGDMNEIVYTVTEVKVKAYSFKVKGDMESGFTVTNRHTKGTGLTTGDETPAWPFILAGVGIVALAAALFINRKRKPNA